ncbi:hypothetical protein [Hymenobacter volaticus]|uniref:ATP-grasp domain-containing protein n=1 Tax=Hymenobacter volaticus TaxID=2932254 RepID=A0ABY4GEM2_9BACT|nr:hypothetical protein [Hymenobacter volaticus]UOQ69245.1 hypothetical protein MUN86_27720 [Hymenobacter volaticus]
MKKLTGIDLKNNGCSNERATIIFYDKYSRNNFINIIKVNSKFIGIDIYDFCLNIDIDFSASGAKISSSKYDIELINKSNIIYYPYSYESVFFDPIKGDSYYKFVKRQFASILLYLENIFDLSLGIINTPTNARKWSNKLYQLGEVSKFLPEYTIQTKIKSKYSDSEIGSIIKHLSETRGINKYNDSMALRVNKEVKNELSHGTALPYISQKYIKSTMEYRCYVFGYELILLKFSRKDLPSDIIDIHFNMELLKNAILVKITDSQLEMIDKISKLTQLKMFSVDFFSLSTNKLFIIEVNPLSSWHWLPIPIILKLEEALKKFIDKILP